MGAHTLKGWSKIQALIALSSGEAELGGIVKAATEGLGVRAILTDFGLNTGIHLKSDATAANGMVHRLGLGKVRHLAVGDWWIQERVRAGDLKVSKWPGTENPSDQQTKNLSAADIQRHTEASGWYVPREPF